MSIVLPTVGQDPWDATMATLLNGLDARIAALEGATPPASVVIGGVTLNNNTQSATPFDPFTTSFALDATPLRTFGDQSFYTLVDDHTVQFTKTGLYAGTLTVSLPNVGGLAATESVILRCGAQDQDIAKAAQTQYQLDNSGWLTTSFHFVADAAPSNRVVSMFATGAGATAQYAQFDLIYMST